MGEMTRKEAINVLDVLWDNPLFSEAHRQAFEIGIKAIKALEQEPKTGHWIEHPTEEDYSVCSRCGIGSRRMEHGKNADGTKYIDIYSYRFCPYCGAKMIEPQEREDKE